MKGLFATVFVTVVFVVKGIDVQAQVAQMLEQLRSRRVAFLTNPTGVDDKLVPLYEKVM